MGKLIALTGLAGCGKTTIARELEKLGYVRLRFADPLKDMLRALGLSAEQVDGNEKNTPSELICGKTPRYAMQTLGTEWGRYAIGDDIWINLTMRRVNEVLNAGGDVVIDDLRFDNEAKALTRKSAIIVRVYRVEAALTQQLHASEAGIEDGWVTTHVHNDGTIEATMKNILGLL